MVWVGLMSDHQKESEYVLAMPSLVFRVFIFVCLYGYGTVKQRDYPTKKLYNISQYVYRSLFVVFFGLKLSLTLKNSTNPTKDRVVNEDLY